MEYRAYQQVINLSVRPKKKVVKNKTTRSRTRTGCLTCRKRKKKCDENVVDGKCQGCTRNFLECSWQIRQNLIPFKEYLPNHHEPCSLESDKTKAEIHTRERRLSTSSMGSISSLVSLNEPSTPRSPANYAVDKEMTNRKFVITSLQHNKLCSIND